MIYESIEILPEEILHLLGQVYESTELNVFSFLCFQILMLFHSNEFKDFENFKWKGYRQIKYFSFQSKLVDLDEIKT